MTLVKWPVPDVWAPLIDDYLAWLRASGAPSTTIDTRRQHLSHLARGIEATPSEVTGAVLVEWVGAQTWARETRRGRRTTFRSFWDWAVSAERVECDAAAALPKVRAGAPSPHPLPRFVLDEAMSNASPRVALILRLAVECGLRRAEIAQVHRRDVVDDLLGRSLIVHGKGAKERVIPLPEALGETLAAVDGWVFPGRDNGHLSPRYVGKLAARALSGAWTLHAGRHRFATLAHRECGDLLVVQDLLGHRSPVTTRAYIAPDTSRARAVIQALAA